MRLTLGARLGPYEVTAQIGKGGMGEVYQATDTNLGRQVAIKVLPDAFAQDADRLARFEREARTLASLNHPNIAQIYGLEKSGGIHALVMELVEGLTLAERLAQSTRRKAQGASPPSQVEGREPSSGLSVDDAIAMARQVAEALEAAHERGIVHRDLKPANIKLRPDGVVKVLDFGLAKLTDPNVPNDPADPNAPTNSPTLSIAATQAGTILGTAAYMSPEQARGMVVDKRADIWAFGAVLFEMLTGKRAFGGEDISDTLANVLKVEPKWEALPSGLSPTLAIYLKRCLHKDSRQRVGDIRDVRLALEGAFDPAVPDDDVAGRWAADRLRSRGRERLALGLAGLLLLSTLAMGVAWSRSGTSSASRPAPEMRVEVAAPQRANEIATFALSPDGTRLAFVSQGRVWVRPLESENAQALAGTDGVAGSNNGSLFWSPDGESIGFAAQGQLKRIDLRSGLARSLAAVGPNPIGGTWASDGTILFVPSPASPVLRISPDGGDAVAATTFTTGHVGHRFPHFLPDGRHYIFLAVGTKETRGIYVGSLDSPDTRRILESDSRALFSPPDALLYMRQGALEARRLNLETLSLEGDARPVASRVLVASLGFNNVAMSGSAGLLAYRSHEGVARLTWVDRSGRRLGELGESDAATPRMLRGSPGATLVGMQRTVGGNADVWVLDTERGVRRRLTFGDERDGYPVWSPDGSRVAFSSERTGVFDLFERPADGSGNETALLSSAEPKQLDDWSPDGRNLLFSVLNREGAYDLWALPLTGDRRPVALTQTQFRETAGRFSPDGRWIAYESNETGRNEIYVQSFPDLKVKVQVSAQGGIAPQWRSDGRELFYQTTGQLMAVPIDLSGAPPRPGAPVALFPSTANWWPSSDGQRFLITEEVEPPAPITLLLNWAGVPR